jgi:hypothetical protein
LLSGLTYQPAPNPGALKVLIDGKVRYIAAKTEVGNRSGDTNEMGILPGGHYQISMAQHAGYGSWIVNGPAVGERGTAQDADKLFRRNDLADSEVGHGDSSSVLLTASR